MRLGAQTHFSQGWDPSLLSRATALRAMVLRDSVRWTDVEKAPGTYSFSSRRIAALQSACGQGIGLILTQPPQNPLYDGGKTVWSATGMAAYARFIDAILRHLGRCVVAIEVGNEINGRNLRYPKDTDKFAAYVGLLRILQARIKPAHPDVVLLGGSTNQIGTGFLKQLFARGMLPLVDGVAVHPYRRNAQGIDIELAHLASAMKAQGRVVPVWVTEFSHDLDDPEMAAAEQLKMVTLLAGSNVQVASWYALMDQPYFPRMGLYRDSGIKPAGEAFRNVRERLIPYGRPKRLAVGDDLLNVWRFPDGRMVVWGAPRVLQLTRAASLFDARGKALPQTDRVRIGEAPLVIIGAGIASVGRSPVLADTLLAYGRPQWGQFARSKGGKYTALSLQDDWFTSYFGNRRLRPLRIGLGAAAPGGTRTQPVRVVLRYTAKEDAAAQISACFGKKPAGDGVDYAITHNGKVVKVGLVTQQATISALPLDLEAGDVVELSFGPNREPGNDSFRYRATIFRKGEAAPVTCP